MNTNIDTAYKLFTDKATRPTLCGELANADGCMCAQGCVLHHIGGKSVDSLIRYSRGQADKDTAELLGISLFHSIVLRKINDKKSGCPEDVLIAERDADAAVRVFGPQGPELFAMGRSIDLVTVGQRGRMAAAWAAAGDAAWDAARAAARAAAGDAAWAAAGDAAWAAAWDAARAAARAAAWDAAWDAARAAARALAVRDLIGTHGFTQDHYDTLTRPWRQAVGKLHADDACMLEGGEA